MAEVVATVKASDDPEATLAEIEKHDTALGAALRAALTEGPNDSEIALVIAEESSRRPPKRR